MSMKMRYSAAIAVILFLSGCGKSTGTDVVHNEVNGRFTSLNNSVYYIDYINEQLYEYNGSESIELSDNAVNVQQYNDTVYFIYTDNHTDYSLYKLSGDETEKVFDLKGENYQQGMIYSNKLYCCMDNSITVYDLETKAENKLEIENRVFRFCVNDKKIYYWSVDFEDMTFDDYIENIDKGEETNIFNGALYSFDTESNTSQKLFEVSTSDNRFFVSPVQSGIVFNDSDKSEIKLYNNDTIETLCSGKVSAMVTDSNNVYYSTDDGDGVVYKTDINGNTDVFAEDVFRICGLNDKYIYSELGELAARD